MMMKALQLSQSSPQLMLSTRDAYRKSLPSPTIISCSSSPSSKSKNDAYIPKLEPFSRTKFDRVVKDPPLIEKSESELADYCSTLEGDPSYSCWRAYFELKDLERESPKQDVERLILQAGGVKSLIGCIHGIAAIHKAKTEGAHVEKQVSEDTSGRKPFPVPDGLPKTPEELEEEERARMPDSPFTRLLRNKGKHPAWYSAAPDHEYD